MCITLTHRQIFLHSDLLTLLDDLFVQLCISGIVDILLLHRRIAKRSLVTRSRSVIIIDPNAFGQNQLDPFFAY